MRDQHAVNEGFFRLPLHNKMKSYTHDGRPPITFFSQSSESE